MDINTFFNKSLTLEESISFLIDGRKHDASIYNYIVRKISSQIQSSQSFYPMGPSLLVYDTSTIIYPITRDNDPIILRMIDKIDKDGYYSCL